MKISLDKLDAHLAAGLAPVYFFSSDEPLQLGEAADAVRRAARAQGFGEREVLEVDKGFDWHSLLAAGNAMSLFAERKLIDLRIPSGKPGKEGSEALLSYLERPPEDTVLLITSGKIDRQSQQAKWFKAIEAAGIALQIWPVEAREMPQWLTARLHIRGLRPAREAVAMLAERVEGNLLAAAQEVEKLLLLYGEGELSAEQVEAAVSDSARFDVYNLVDVALLGDIPRLTRMLEGLRGEGVEPILILWALSREIRSLAQMATQLEQGQPTERVLAPVWAKRKAAVQAGLRRHNSHRWQQMLRRAARLDRVVKGAAAGNPWDDLLQLGLMMAGTRLFRAAG